MSEQYTDGSGQMITVHDAVACAGEHCVIHNPSDHSMRDFPTYWRHDRQLMERICSHGVGHPDPDDLAFAKARNPIGFAKEARGVHGCDGCCA